MDLAQLADDLGGSGTEPLAVTTVGAVAVRPLLALFALFSGIALLLNIIGQIDLRLGLVAMISVVAIGWAPTIRRVSPAERARILRSVAYGAVAGVVATLAYDVSKRIMSELDPSPFDPFHAIQVFGTLLVGTGAGPAATLAAGWAFHILNGTAFGVAYALLFARNGRITARRAVLTGLGWGLFLETFQLTLYPGWLDIRAYAEFAQISFLAHLVYGATLGTLTRWMFRRIVPGSSGGDGHG
jgi:hypothetical protein